MKTNDPLVELAVTPVEHLRALARGGGELWIKRDDRTSPLYGGNKARKLAYILADARARGATRLVTVGAVGSHHVLATTLFGRLAGFTVEAALVPQPRSPHVVENVRADLALGLRAHPAGSWAAAPFVLLRARPWARDAYWVTLGGSSTAGTCGYVDAARELAVQVREGEMPEPDVVVTALGSGGTVAGLAAGLALAGLRTRVVAVCVAPPMWATELLARRLVRRVLRRLDARHVAPQALAKLAIEKRFMGSGYGHPTPAGDEARALAAAQGIALDTTYTAKAFAAALAQLDEGRARTVLYWHTLSSASLTEHLAGAPREADLAPRVRALLL